jgi:CCR4-NOT transcription complex subunit 3
MASILKAGLTPPIPRTRVGYSVAAAGGSHAAAATQPVHGNSSQPGPHVAPPASASVSPPNPPPVQPTAPSIPQPSIPQPTPPDQSSGRSSSPSLTHPSTTSPMLSSSASVSHQPDGSFYSGQESPALSDGVPSSLGGPAATSSPPRAMTRKGLFGFVDGFTCNFNTPHPVDSIPSPPRAASQSPSVSVRIDDVADF